VTDFTGIRTQDTLNIRIGGSFQRCSNILGSLPGMQFRATFRPLSGKWLNNQYNNKNLDYRGQDQHHQKRTGKCPE
jgi:hypothetical protein